MYVNYSAVKSKQDGTQKGLAKTAYKENGGKIISKTVRFPYNINKYRHRKINSLIKSQPFRFELLTIGFHIVNQWFSCRKPMAFDV